MPAFAAVTKPFASIDATVESEEAYVARLGGSRSQIVDEGAVDESTSRGTSAAGWPTFNVHGLVGMRICSMSSPEITDSPNDGDVTP